MTRNDHTGAFLSWNAGGRIRKPRRVESIGDTTPATSARDRRTRTRPARVLACLSVESGRSRVVAVAVRVLAVFLVWTALAALLARRRVVTFERGVGAEGLAPTFTSYLAVFSIRAALTLPVLALARRFPLRRGELRRGLAIHAAFGVGFAIVSRVLQEALGAALPRLVGPDRALGVDLGVEVVVYFLIVGVCHVADLSRRSRERERRAAELEVQAARLREGLAQAQLDALRAQLNPHFLFNTLNTISVLMSEDVVAANRMLLRLGDLLRTSLTTAATQEVELAQELEFVRGYLEIEQARLSDRLSVRLDIEPAALGARVPSLLLQPLVENAVRHGIAPRVGAGVIEIRAARRGDMLELSVRDDGPGLSSAPLRDGIGLSATRSRLERLHGPRHRFDLRDADGGGLLVSVSLPGWGVR